MHLADYLILELWLNYHLHGFKVKILLYISKNETRLPHVKIIYLPNTK